MKSAHIAVFTYMADGHVNPYLDVSSELIRRGHRVTFPAHKRFSVRMHETGVDSIELKYRKLGSPNTLLRYKFRDDAIFWKWFGSVNCPWFLMEALSIVGELEEFYVTNPPDLVLYEGFNLAGRIFAKNLQRPAIQVCTHFAHRNSITRSDGVWTNPKPMLEFSPVLDNFMSVLGFEGRDQIWHAEPMNIFLIPKEFQFEIDSFDTRFRFVGVTFSGRSKPALRTIRPNGGKPLLLISEGSSSTDDTFLTLCIEAFAESPYQVVFIAGVHNIASYSETVPCNFEVYRNISNREILPIADVVVCQAGMGTTLESLYHGVPVVGVPPNPFNSEVAFRIAELGVGLYILEETMTAIALKSAVDIALTNQALRSRVKLMRAALKSNRGAELAANAVEEFLE